MSIATQDDGTPSAPLDLEIQVDPDGQQFLNVHLTNEGIILDCVVDGEVVATKGMTYGEWFESIRMNPVIRIVFTAGDIEDEIDAVDENRGADNKPPLDPAKAMNDVLEWASSIQDAATQRLYESLDSVIETGQA